MVDPEVDRAQLRPRHGEPLADRGRRVLGDRDHEPRAPHGAQVRGLAVGDLGAREELGEELVLDVEHARHGRRRRHRREHHREREVEGVEPAEASEERPSPHGCERHRRHAAGNRARRAVLRDDLRRQPVHVVGDRRQEDPVVELADAAERAHELARVRFGAPADPRHEREQANADHGGNLPLTDP